MIFRYQFLSIDYPGDPSLRTGSGTFILSRWSLQTQFITGFYYTYGVCYPISFGEIKKYDLLLMFSFDIAIS